MIKLPLDRYDGTRDGNQVNFKCPLCRRLKLDVTLGDNGSLIANCFSRTCKGRGAEILKIMGLPLHPLSDIERRQFVEEYLDGHLPGATVQPAPIEARHAAYSSILAQCPPDDHARSFLRERGFTEEDIDRYKYGRWPVPDLKPPEDLTIPGIFKTEGFKVCLDSPRYAGVVFPCRDVAGRIGALKLRLYNPDEKGKIRTFSSAWWGGPSGVRMAHFPLGTRPGEDRVIIVEGELKADRVFAARGVNVISLPGGNTF